MMKHLAAIAFSFTLTTSVLAEDYNQPQLQSIVDSFVAELQKAGAKNVGKGTVNYDSATKTFTVSDFSAEFPESVKTEKTETEDSSTSTKTTREAVDLKIAKLTATNLTNDGASWFADTVRADGITVALKDKAGAMTIAAISFRTINAPRLEASAFGKEFGESLITFFQDSSYADAAISGVVFKGESKEGEHQGTLNLKLGDIAITNVNKGKGTAMTMAPSVMTTSMNEDEDEEAKKPAPDKTITKKESDGGKAKSITKSDAEADDVPKTFRMEMKKAEVNDFDIGLYADFFRAKPRRAGQKDQPLYASAKFDGVDLIADNFSFKVNPVTTTNSRMNVPQNGVLALFDTIAGAETLSKEAQDKMFGFYRDWLSLTVVGELKSEGATFKSKDTNFSVASITGKELGATVGELSVNSFDLKSPEFNGTFESMKLRKIDTATFTNAMMEELQRNPESPNYAILEGKLPTFGLVEFNGLSLQSKDEDALLVSRVAFELDSWVRFVPQRLRSSVEKAVIPAGALKDIGHPDLKDLGYKQLVTGSELQFKLDKDAKTAILSPAKIDLGEAGSVNGSMHLGNVDETMFGASILGEDITKLGEARFDKFTFELVNGNFLERFIDWRVKSSGTSKSEIREEIAQMFKIYVALIVDEKQRAKAQLAVDGFINGSKTLTLTVTPKDKMSLLDIQLGWMVNSESLTRKLNFDLVAK